MNRLLQLGALIVISLFFAASMVASPAVAVKCSGKGASTNNPLCKAQGGVNKVGGSNKGNSTSLTSRIHNIINLIIYVLGAVATIMIVVGGIRYTTSGGDQSGITSAKNTIMYAVVGLVVALMAYGIVGLVIGRIQ